MSVTVFPDLVLTNQWIEGGVKGRQIRKNQRVSTTNGFESINIVWDRTLREYDIGIGPLRRSTWQQLETLHEVTEGGAYGFLLLDPKDSTVTVAQGRVAALTGGGYQLYQRKTETVSTRYKDRKITRPKAASVLVYVSGVLTGATVDAETGQLTITGNPDAATVTWSGIFYVPVHFLSDTIDWEMLVHGPDPDSRFIAGPLVTLQEIRE
jgi:uncharacterized protein (TIGR02217 family)